MRLTIDDLITEAKKARGDRPDAAEDFENEAAPLYQNEETDDETEDDAEPQAVSVKKHRRATAPKLSIQFDKTATDLTEALSKLTAAINAITPQPVGGEPQREAPAVKVSITVNIDATPLVNGLTDGVRAVAGGEREGQLSAALRETLKDFHALRLDKIPKKDASQFLASLSRRLEDGAQTKAVEAPQENTEEPQRETITPEPSQSVETVKPVDLTPQDKPQRIEAPQVDPQPEAVTDAVARQLVDLCKTYAATISPQNRPKLVSVLSRYDAGRWEDIPRHKLAEALGAVKTLHAEDSGDGGTTRHPAQLRGI